MSRLHHYLSLIVFVAAVMVGAQAPNFVDQYVKRVDAHYLEAEEQFKQYRAIVDLYHRGSVESLIIQHQDSSDPTFKAEAGAIRNSYVRLQRFTEEQKALSGGRWSQMFHMVFSGDREIMRETRANYSANVPLNWEAGICGIILGCIASVVLEILLWVLSATLNRVLGGSS